MSSLPSTSSENTSGGAPAAAESGSCRNAVCEPLSCAPVAQASAKSMPSAAGAVAPSHERPRRCSAGPRCRRSTSAGSEAGATPDGSTTMTSPGRSASISAASAGWASVRRDQLTGAPSRDRRRRPRGRCRPPPRRPPPPRSGDRAVGARSMACRRPIVAVPRAVMVDQSIGGSPARTRTAAPSALTSRTRSKNGGTPAGPTRLRPLGRVPPHRRQLIGADLAAADVGVEQVPDGWRRRTDGDRRSTRRTGGRTRAVRGSRAAHPAVALSEHDDLGVVPEVEERGHGRHRGRSGSEQTLGAGVAPRVRGERRRCRSTRLRGGRSPRRARAPGIEGRAMARRRPSLGRSRAHCPGRAPRRRQPVDPLWYGESWLRFAAAVAAWARSSIAARTTPEPGPPAEPADGPEDGVQQRGQGQEDDAQQREDPGVERHQPGRAHDPEDEEVKAARCHRSARISSP